MTAGRGPGGFTLVEVVVALLVLEVGLSAVAALSFVAARHLARARTAEWAVAATASVADSLARSGVTGGGERVTPAGRLLWSADSEPAPGVVGVLFEARSLEGRLLLRSRSVLPASVDSAGADGEP